MQIVKLIDPPVQIGVTGFLTAMGAYAADTDYAVGDVVSYNGSSYVMYADAAAGTAPTETANWQILINANDYVSTLTTISLTNPTTGNTVSVDQNGDVGTSVATDGAVHIENTGNTGIGLGVYTNIGATAASELVSILIDNVDFARNGVKIKYEGTLPAISGAVFIDWNGPNTNSACAGLHVYSNYEHLSGSNGKGLVLITNDNAASVSEVLSINNDGSGRCVFVDHDDTGVNASVDVDRDGNNAAYIFGVKITVDNAGAGGLVCGIDFSGMSDTEPLFKFPSASPDADLSSKSPETDAEAGWIPVMYGTTKYAMPVYALS
jgi:hypothetical protein